MPPLRSIEFGRDICGNPLAAGQREWLTANGIGGFASGTISGELTRRYHGLLVAALQPPVGRTLLVTKFNEVALYAGERYVLGTDRWKGGELEPQGYLYLERFALQGSIPAWWYAYGDALLRKQVWMRPGENTTCIRYCLERATAPLDIDLEMLVNYRDYHTATLLPVPMQITTIPRGLKVEALPGGVPVYLMCAQGVFTVDGAWISDYSLEIERERGFDGLEAHCRAGGFHAVLGPGEALTLVASTHQQAELDGDISLSERVHHEQALYAALHERLRAKLRAPSGVKESGRVNRLPVGGFDLEVMERLALAADQFIVARRIAGDEPGHSVIAGYPWFSDWGRDTMISLPGLTLSAGRPEIAASILRTYARFVDQGMLPNRFPDAGQAPEYNTVDATLWYFEALGAYLESTGAVDGYSPAGLNLLAELYPVLEEIIDWHHRGTRYHIHADPADGLLYAGQPGVQLTWMDARVGDWVVTPRTGKPVEINALWYNALCCMGAFSRALGKHPAMYHRAAERVRASFSRYWYPASGYCYDVLDGPHGNDPSLRPNQLIAAALPHSPLSAEQAKAVVDACARHLLTSHGLRSLARTDPAYIGGYGGDLRSRDAAYHQGTVWSWLIGPFVRAHLRVYADRQAARSFLLPLVDHLWDHGLGSISEIFDGEEPFTPRGCFAQAWGVAELLRAWEETCEPPT